MRKEIEDYLFDSRIKENIHRQSVENYLEVREQDQNKAFALLIAHVLKFKRKDTDSDTGFPDFAKLRERSLGLLEKTVGSRMPGKIAQRIAVAAAVLILFSITGYWVGNRHIFTGRDNQAQVIEFKTPKGQHSELLLPDGTFVSMNFDSKLKYYISREKAIQEVELNGEAFFKVAKNKQRVFRVITENMKVNVLGTEFNVKAYHRDLKTETTLLEGSIEITDIPEEDRSVLLKAGEKWTYNKVEKSQEITTSDSHLASLWRNGEYYFEKITFAELSRVLERMYKVEISFLDPDLEKEVYSGIIYQQDQIDELFRMINLTIPIRVEKKGNSIRISRK